MSIQATAAQVRKTLKSDGCDVRISRDGRVTFRRAGETMWLEGRYVTEYVVINGRAVLV